jgi:NAD(P)-dependent dehydrogenase (short-subunit alcohol dehydrogenase family)
MTKSRSMKDAVLSLALASGIAAAWTFPTSSLSPFLMKDRRMLSSSSSSSSGLMAAAYNEDGSPDNDDSSSLRRRDFLRLASSKAASISLLALTTSSSLAAPTSPSSIDVTSDAAASTSTPDDDSPIASVPYSKIYKPAPHSMDGKVVLITGGNAGLGLESTKRLAEAGAWVVFTSRDEARGARALEEVAEYLSGLRATDPTFVGRVDVAYLDLCDMSNVKAFKERLMNVIGKDVKIDVLMNNAGVMAIPDRRLTKDGYETTFQTNHLGHFALTSILMPLLSPNARIINVSSMAHQFASAHGLELDNLNGEREYGPWSSYGQSKLENILFASELQRRARTSSDWSGLSVFSLHPGAVQTDLARYLIGEEKFQKMKEGGFSSWTDRFLMEGLAKFVKTVQEGASTQVYLAASADVGPKDGGSYFSDGKVTPLKAFATDENMAEKLWSVSEKLSGVKFDL